MARLAKESKGAPLTGDDLERVMAITKTLAQVAADHREAEKHLKGEAPEVDFTSPEAIEQLLAIPGFLQAVRTRINSPAPEPSEE